MIAPVTDPADLGVRDAAAALAERSLSSRELVEACLARIRERDGTHSHDGDPGSINAWVRVYEEDALAAADAGRRAARGRRRARALRDPDRPQGPLRRRREAAHRIEPRARRGARAGLRRMGEPRGRGDGPARPSAHARVRLRRHHRPGRQPLVPRALGGRLERRLRRRARVAARCRRRPAPTPQARSASLRPSAGRRRSSRRAGSSRSAGSCPSRRPSTILGPMTRTVARLRAAAGRARGRRARRLIGGRSAGTPSHPRVAELDPDVADGFERALAALPGERVEPPPPAGPARRARRLLRPRPHRDARLPPPLRPTGAATTAIRTAPGSSTPRSGR